MYYSSTGPSSIYISYRGVETARTLSGNRTVYKVYGEQDKSDEYR